MTRGFVAYEGPSRLDQGPVFVVVTLGSGNRKIGDMAQAWVMRSDVAPREALATGLDRAICGDCVHRSGGVTGRSCYVSTQLGPTTIYQAFLARRYPILTSEAGAVVLTGAPLRITAYGDPAAVPFEVWRNLLAGVSGHTAYTHQWRTCDQRFQTFAMASVESDGEVEQAQRLGWRTFRTRLPAEPVRADEIICPASDEAGHQTTCEHCRLCVGQGRPRARSIVIIAHGQRTRWFNAHKTEVSV